MSTHANIWPTHEAALAFWLLDLNHFGLLCFWSSVRYATPALTVIVVYRSVFPASTTRLALVVTRVLRAMSAASTVGRTVFRAFDLAALVVPPTSTPWRARLVHSLAAVSSAVAPWRTGR